MSDTAKPLPPAPPSWRARASARIRRWLLIAAVPAAILLIAALIWTRNDDSDLEVGQITPGTPDYPATAVPYALARLRFALRTVTRITGCRVEAGARPTDPGREILTGVTTLTLQPVTEIDPGARYYLYFDSDSHAKNLDFAVEHYDTGPVKSITVSIKDQVAPITEATAGALMQFLPAGLVLPMHAARGLHPASCAALAETLRSTPADPRLMLTQSWDWVPGPTREGFSAIPDLRAPAADFGLADPAWAQTAARLWVDAAFPRDPPELAPLGKPPHSGQTGRPPLVRGLVLRDALATLLHQAVCDATCAQLATLRQANGGETMLTEAPAQPVTIPQAGQRFLVPVHSGFAQDASAEVTFNPQGAITHLRAQNVNALAGTIKETGAMAGQYINAATNAAATATQNRSLADCLAAQKQVAAAGGTPVGTCTLN